MTTAAGIYARISRDDDGTALGVTRQIGDVEALCRQRGWTIAQRYIDNDVSATTSKVRPQYERMMIDAKAGGIGAIAVWDIDRLTRKPRELEDIIDLADRLGLQLASVGGEVDLGTEQGRLMARMKGSVARYESEQTSRRQKRKALELAESGAVGAFPPFGYRVADERGWVIDPGEAATVRRVAQSVIDGRALRSIASELNREGTLTGRGNPWSSQTIRRTVARPVYAGLKSFKGKIMGPGQWAPILTVDTHERVTAILADPARRTSPGTTPCHLLAGLLVCGLCGGRLISASGRVNRTTGVRRPQAYQCGSCFRVRRLADPIETWVSALIVIRLSDPDATGLFASAERGADVQDAQAGMNAAATKLRVAADQFANDVITAEQLAIISGSTRKRIEQYRDILAMAQDRPDLAVAAGDDAEHRWPTLALDVRRSVIDYLVTVTVRPVGPGARFDPSVDLGIEWKR